MQLPELLVSDGHIHELRKEYTMSQDFNLDEVIRKIPDYPKKGILFFDITSVLMNPEAYHYCINRMVELYKGTDITAVAGIESRGFLFASPLADHLGIPLILVRKAGKLPGDVYHQDYLLEYGDAAVEIHKSDVPEGGHVLLIDDLIATGGTLKASRTLLEQGGATVTNVFGVIGLPFLNYQKNLPGIDVVTLIDYHDEVMPVE